MIEMKAHTESRETNREPEEGNGWGRSWWGTQKTKSMMGGIE